MAMHRLHNMTEQGKQSMIICEKLNKSWVYVGSQKYQTLKYLCVYFFFGNVFFFFLHILKQKVATKQKVAQRVLSYLNECQILRYADGTIKIFISATAREDPEDIIKLQGSRVYINGNAYVSSQCFGIYLHQKYDLSDIDCNELWDVLYVKNQGTIKNMIIDNEIQILNTESKRKINISV